MKKLVLALLILFSPALALAGEAVQGAALEERVAALEKHNAELYHSLAEKKSAGLKTLIGERISISGLLEVEAAAEKGHFRGGNSDSNSDLTLATAQLGFGVKATEKISGDLIFLFEEDENDDEVAVDEATINFESGPWNSRIGRQYLPFGNFHSHFISSPLTSDLGETRETALLSGYGGDLWSLSAFVFNGDAEKEGGEDQIRDFGASLVVNPAEKIEFGASYLSDLADSDADLLEADYREGIGGWSAYAVAGIGPLELSGEILGAAESFEAADLDTDGNGSGDKPMAWNLEAATLVTEAIEVAVRLEGSDEFADQPERQYGICASWGAWKNVSLSLEYLRGEYDRDFAAVDSGGKAQEKRDLVTAQLALEF